MIDYRDLYINSIKLTKGISKIIYHLIMLFSIIHYLYLYNMIFIFLLYNFII